METTVRILKAPELNKPVMVCGLPGIGMVAWLATDHVCRELKGELFGEVLSPSFTPKVWITDDGLVKLMKGDFYYCRSANHERDFIIFQANEQPYSPEGQYELADVILDVAEAFRVERLITMGGMQTESLSAEPKVYAGGTNLELVREMEALGASKLSGGHITGVNGLLFGLAKPREIAAVCLLAETPGFLSFDANAAKAALLVVGKMLGVQIDLGVLERQAKENLEALRKSTGMKVEVQAEKRGQGEKDLSYVS